MLARLSKGLRGVDSQYGQKTCALVRCTGGSQVVHAYGDFERHRGYVGVAEAAISEGGTGQEEGTRGVEEVAGEGIVPVLRRDWRFGTLQRGAIGDYHR